MYEKIINIFLNNTLNIEPGLKSLIIYDASTENLLKYFIPVFYKKNIFTICKKIDLKKNHGFEPPVEIAKSMIESNLVLCLTKYSMAHSKARNNFSKMGGRFLSMPGYSEKILSNKSLLANFKEHDKFTKKISKILTLGKKCKIFSEDGTNLECNLFGRLANSCPGHVMEKGSLGSPPDIEANISPIENQSNGFLTINGSIANEEIGLLNKPVYLIIKNGKIAQIKSSSKKINTLLKKTFYKFGPKSKVLAEIGIGLNKKAKLTGHMLTDEGSYGCIHFGFGSNFSVGGKNKVDFHLDFITKKHSLYVDEKLIIKKGKIVI
jgi:leucyl aminopeptidase (aminopeptidase T)